MHFQEISMGSLSTKNDNHSSRLLIGKLLAKIRLETHFVIQTDFGQQKAKRFM
jgi:hypothetical protein